MEAHWLLVVHNDVDWTDEEALGGEVVREVTTCAECGFADTLSCMPNRVLCKRNNGVWKPNDFCSRGEPSVETRRKD